KKLATGSSDGLVIVRDAATGHEICKFEGCSEYSHSIAFSPDGRRIVIGSLIKDKDGKGLDERSAQVLDAATGKLIFTLKGHKDPVSGVAFSPDGKRIVTGSRDKTAKVWNAQTGQEVFTLKGHAREFSSVAFSPDGRRIVTGSWDKTAKV